MKRFSQLSSFVVLLAGVALLAWVSYDATNVMRSVGLEARMDEATVAAFTLSLGTFMVASGIYIWRRLVSANSGNSA